MMVIEVNAYGFMDDGVVEVDALIGGLLIDNFEVKVVDNDFKEAIDKAKAYVNCYKMNYHGAHIKFNYMDVY